MTCGCTEGHIGCWTANVTRGNLTGSPCGGLITNMTIEKPTRPRSGFLVWGGLKKKKIKGANTWPSGNRPKVQSGPKVIWILKVQLAVERKPTKSQEPTWPSGNRPKVQAGPSRPEGNRSFALSGVGSCGFWGLPAGNLTHGLSWLGSNDFLGFQQNSQVPCELY